MTNQIHRNHGDKRKVGVNFWEIRHHKVLHMRRKPTQCKHDDDSDEHSDNLTFVEHAVVLSMRRQATRCVVPPELVADDGIKDGHEKQWSSIGDNEGGIIKCSLCLRGISKHGPVAITVCFAVFFCGIRRNAHGHHKNCGTQPDNQRNDPNFAKNLDYLVGELDGKESLECYEDQSRSRTGNW